MDTYKKEIVNFFIRDLNQLVKELEMVPKEYVWKPVAGITNSCGILAQHIAGNLNHYIGTCMGDTGYDRDRNREFTNTGQPKEKLIEEINKTAEMIKSVVTDLTADELENPYPFFDKKSYTYGQFLLHLYGHLNYHLGQVNYLRRILTENNG